VIRPLANSSEPAVIQISLRKAKRSGKSNVRLGPGDIVSVEQTPATVLLEALQLIRVGVNGTAGLF
jgi:polysaccharide export outer membrane protein